MSEPNFSKKTDADLARFCAVKSGALTRLQAKIAAADKPDPDLIRDFDEAADLLERATDELHRRTDQP
jgi:hypothetical protein